MLACPSITYAFTTLNRDLSHPPSHSTAPHRVRHSLDNNTIGDEAAKALVAAIQQCPSLQTLRCVPFSIQPFRRGATPLRFSFSHGVTSSVPSTSAASLELKFLTPSLNRSELKLKRTSSPTAFSKVRCPRPLRSASTPGLIFSFFSRPRRRSFPLRLQPRPSSPRPCP